MKTKFLKFFLLCHYNASKKCKSIHVKSRHLPGPSGGDPFGLLANCFLSFFLLTVFIFSMLLANIKSGQGPRPVDRATNSSCSPLFFQFNMQAQANALQVNTQPTQG